MMRVPKWVFLLLLPVVFLGTFLASGRPIWNWLERGFVRSVDGDIPESFLLLARASDGKYLVSFTDGETENAEIVRSMEGIDEAEVNRDLCDSLGINGYHRYFEVTFAKNGSVLVSLEHPTRRNAKLKGWYAIEEGRVVPKEILAYGPGFALLVIPWSGLADLGAVLLFTFFVRPKQRHKPPPLPA